MVIVGDARAVGQAVKDDSIGERHSKLAEWLAERAGADKAGTGEDAVEGGF
jgi:hypothetical protein